MRPRLATGSLMHSHAKPMLKTFEELSLSDVDLISYNSDDNGDFVECAAPVAAF